MASREIIRLNKLAITYTATVLLVIELVLNPTDLEILESKVQNRAARAA